MTTTAFRAAYIPADAGSTSGGVLLTEQDQANLPDDELLAVARDFAASNGVQGEIIIGEWRE